MMREVNLHYYEYDKEDKKILKNKKIQIDNCPKCGDFLEQNEKDIQRGQFICLNCTYDVWYDINGNIDRN